VFFTALETFAFRNASGITLLDGGLGEKHISAAYLAFGWDEFGR